MNQDNDPDPSEAPHAIDRPFGRRRVRSLPGPRRDTALPALGPPSPTIEPAAERTPVPEISLSPGHVYVTVDLPGVPKDALDVQATERTLTVVGPREGAPAYRLQVDLPVAVHPESAKATYRNGILDVTLDRRDRFGSDSHGA